MLNSTNLEEVQFNIQLFCILSNYFKNIAQIMHSFSHTIFKQIWCNCIPKISTTLSRNGIDNRYCPDITLKSSRYSSNIIQILSKYCASRKNSDYKDKDLCTNIAHLLPRFCQNIVHLYRIYRIYRMYCSLFL